MYFSCKAELPSGSRLKIERAGAVWVACFASTQMVIKPEEIADFKFRAAAWVSENLSGLSEALALIAIEHFASIVREADAAERLAAAAL
jgi:hypothetical protein